MPKQTINVGAVADDGTGDNLRAGAIKINENFTELYGLVSGAVGEYVTAARWRMLVTAAGSSGECRISELELFGPASANFLINSPGTGSISASTERVGNEATKAIDLNFVTNNGWRPTASNEIGAWLEYEFLTPAEVREWKISPDPSFFDACPLESDIQYWDGAAWVTLTSVTTAWPDANDQTFLVDPAPPASPGILTDAPSDTDAYGRRDGAWVKVAEEAAIDGKSYVRKYCASCNGALSVPYSFRPVATVSAASYDVLATDDGKYLRFTNTGAKTVNVRLDATEALPADGEWHIRNAAVSSITFAPVGGVTINIPAGGTLIVPPAGTVTLKRVAADVFDLFGQVNAA